jgi:hypothetical protein
VVQTGPNNQFGGVSTGFIKPAYQVGIADIVEKEPATPASNGIAIQMIRRTGERSECEFIGRPD